MIGVMKDSLGDFAFLCMAEAGREVFLTTQGTSMLPLIRPGDRLSIRAVPASRIERGDVFAHWVHGSVVVHRCVGKKSHEGRVWLCEKGDHLSRWTWVPEMSVIGKAIRLERSGRVLNLSASPWAVIGRVMATLCHLRIAIEEKTLKTALEPEPGGVAVLIRAMSRMMARMEHILWALSAKCIN